MNWNDSDSDYFLVTGWTWGALHGHLKWSQWLQSSFVIYLFIYLFILFIYNVPNGNYFTLMVSSVRRG